MPKSPFFSIVTVTLNAAEALRKTAESVRSQIEEDHEWIVVDGASGDDTIVIARRYMDLDRDTLVSEADQGVYFAMNKGLQIARGKFVVFLNAGDRFAQADTLATVRAACAAEVDVVHGDVEFDTPRAGIVLRRSGDCTDGVTRRVFASHQSVYIRRTTHLCRPFDTQYRFAADYAVFSTLYARGFRFYYLPEPLSITTVDTTSLSVRNRPLMAWEDFQVNRKILKAGWISACWKYAVSLCRILAVKAMLSLPHAVHRILPEKIARRVY